MKSYTWWLKQKRRVQKKYTLLCGRYLSPKELKEWYKAWCQAKKAYLQKEKKKKNENSRTTKNNCR